MRLSIGAGTAFAAKVFFFTLYSAYHWLIGDGHMTQRAVI